MKLTKAMISDVSFLSGFSLLIKRHARISPSGLALHIDWKGVANAHDEIDDADHAGKNESR